jgi:hypothetical protein
MAHGRRASCPRPHPHCPPPTPPPSLTLWSGVAWGAHGAWAPRLAARRRAGAPGAGAARGGDAVARARTRAARCQQAWVRGAPGPMPAPPARAPHSQTAHASTAIPKRRTAPPKGPPQDRQRAPPSAGRRGRDGLHGRQRFPDDRAARGVGRGPAGQAGGGCVRRLPKVICGTGAAAPCAPPGARIAASALGAAGRSGRWPPAAPRARARPRGPPRRRRRRRRRRRTAGRRRRPPPPRRAAPRRRAAARPAAPAPTRPGRCARRPRPPPQARTR